jgi:putative membrane protein
MAFLLYFLVVAGAMLLMARLLPGFEVDGWGSALLAAVVLGVVNAIIKPILFVLTLPFTILTLGLFLLVLNALMLWLTDVLVGGLKIHGFGTTLVASVLLALLGMVWKAATRRTE